MLPCCTVRDLLPQYLEKLTEDETRRLLEEHLESCADCRKRAEEMSEEISLGKVLPGRFDFLKKLRRRNIAGAVLSVIVALFCMIALYQLEFINAADIAGVEAVIQGGEGGEDAGKVRVLASQTVANGLLVLFEQPERTDTIHGVARFRRGVFGGYCLREIFRSDWQLHDWSVIGSGLRDYLAIWGIQELPEAETFAIITDRETEEPLYTGETEAPLFIVKQLTKQEAKSLREIGSQFSFVHYYDADGQELDAFELAAVRGNDGSAGGGWSKASQAIYFVIYGIILLVGFLAVRYFVKP